MTNIYIAHNRQQVPPFTIAIPTTTVLAGKIATEAYLKRNGYAGYSFLYAA